MFFWIKWKTWYLNTQWNSDGILVKRINHCCLMCPTYRRFLTPLQKTTVEEKNDKRRKFSCETMLLTYFHLLWMSNMKTGCFQSRLRYNYCMWERFRTRLMFTPQRVSSVRGLHNKCSEPMSPLICWFKSITIHSMYKFPHDCFPEIIVLFEYTCFTSIGKQALSVYQSCSMAAFCRHFDYSRLLCWKTQSQNQGIQNSPECIGSENYMNKSLLIFTFNRS